MLLLDSELMLISDLSISYLPRIDASEGTDTGSTCLDCIRIMALLRPLHPSVALQRLKSNLFFLFLAWTATTIFTPFTTLVRGSIWLIDEKLGSGSLMAWTWSLLGKSREYYKILV